MFQLLPQMVKAPAHADHGLLPDAAFTNYRVSKVEMQLFYRTEY